MADDRRQRRGHDRFARPPSAAPVEIDPENTPLPGDTDAAIAQLWPLRHIDERIERAERAIAGANAEIKGYTNQVARHEAQMEQWIGLTQQCVADLDHASRKQTELGAHLDAFFERDWKRITESLDSVSAALQDLGQRLSRLEVNVKHVDGEQTSQAAKLIALDGRVTELERIRRDGAVASAERIRIFTFARVAIVAAAGVVGWLAKHFFG